MSEWSSININRNLIKYSTEKAVLIACPHSSVYDGYCFWHPKKLVRRGRNREAVSISYTNDFTFRLIKYGKGQYNRDEIIDELQIGSIQFNEVFTAIGEKIMWGKR